VRELFEETGVTADKIELIARAPRELTYDLPEDMIGKVWKGKWRGQRQTWFLYRFLGQDGDIRIETERPEFRAWRWIEPASLPAMIVPFKKALYEELLVVFADHFAAAGGDAAIPAGGQSA
jgi:putative (di)nucleoside polyphosphate hydrolase